MLLLKATVKAEDEVGVTLVPGSSGDEAEDGEAEDGDGEAGEEARDACARLLLR